MRDAGQFYFGDSSNNVAAQEQLYRMGILASIGELAAGVAHELNNPLTSVLGYSQLLLCQDVPQVIRNDLEMIHKNAERAAKIVRNLLTFARRQTPEKVYLDLNEVIKQAVDMRRYELKVSNIEVITQLSPDLPWTMADPQQLQQVVLNIVINAEQSMLEAHGRGALTLKTEMVSDVIKISFSDDGPGIAEDNLYRIFNPFFTTKEVGSGTGLGLSICHGIVVEHAGQIYAVSKKGRGATFIVELPVVPEEKQDFTRSGDITCDYLQNQEVRHG